MDNYTLKKLTQEYARNNDQNSIDQLIDDPEKVSVVDKRQRRQYIIKSVIKIAALTNNTELLEKFPAINHIYEIVDYAARGRHMQLVAKYAPSNEFWTIVRGLAVGGHFDLLAAYNYETNNELLEEYITGCIKGGHIDHISEAMLTKFFIEHGLHHRIVATAVKYNRLSIIQLLYSIGPAISPAIRRVLINHDWFEYHHVTLAMERNYWDMAYYLLSIICERYLEYGINALIATTINCRNLEMLQFLFALTQRNADLCKHVYKPYISSCISSCNTSREIAAYLLTLDLSKFAGGCDTRLMDRGCNCFKVGRYTKTDFDNEREINDVTDK